MSTVQQNREGNIIPAFAYHFCLYFTYHVDMVWWKCKKNSHTVLCMVNCMTCSFQ